MKILFVTTWYYPAKVGGGSQMVKNFAEELVKQGNEVEVWTTDYINGRAEPIQKVEKKIDYINGVKVIYYRGYFHKWQAKTKQVISLELFKNFFTKEIDKFDVINLVESKSIASLVIMNALRIRKKNNIAHFAFGSLGERNINIKHKIYDELVLKPFLNNNCSWFFAQTNHEIKRYKIYLEKYNYKKIHLLPLAVDVKDNIQKAKKYEGILRKELKNENIRLFLFLGRLTANKGIKRLIESFSKTKPSKNNLFLAIVGYDEGYKKELEFIIKNLKMKDYIKILDPVYGDKRFGYYKDADYFIITSTFYEETSLASLEALSIGTPVIVTPEVELPYLEEYEAGFIANSSNESIKNKILEIIKKDYNIISKNALKLAYEKFDISNVTKLLLNYYKKG